MVAAGTEAGEGLYDRFVAARGGDRDALNDLLREIRPPILQDIRSRVRSAPASEAVARDLTQDALLKMAVGLPDCRAGTEAQLWAWCRTIARRVVIDWYRKSSLELERGAEGDLSEHLRVHGLVGQPGHPKADPGTFRSELDQTLGEILLEAQAALSPGTQRVLVSRLLYSDTWRAAGSRIDTSRGGAKRRYQRALERLRREVLERIGQLEREELRSALLERLGEGG